MNRRYPRIIAIVVTTMLMACAAPVSRPMATQESAPQTKQETSEAPTPISVPSMKVDVSPPTRETPPAGPTPNPAKAMPRLDPLRNIFFADGSAELADEGAPAIDDVAKRLNSDRRSSVWLVGYTAHLGSIEYGVALASKRIDAVADALVKRGVQPTQIHQLARGNHLGWTPACSGAACKRLLQRVEIQFID